MFSDVPHQGVPLCHMDRFMQEKYGEYAGATATVSRPLPLIQVPSFIIKIQS
jgi:hypothetical protein